MKLNDIGRSPLAGTNKILESRFGLKINFNKLTIKKADDLLSTVNEAVDRVRMSKNIHTSERDSRYMELLMVKESLENWLDQQYLAEGEVETAQAILASKDFVDRLQGMVEELSKMLNQDLASLGDSIKDQIGPGEGSGFIASATETLNSLLEATKAARESMDVATRVLSGQQAPEMPSSEQMVAQSEITEPEDMSGAADQVEPEAAPPESKLPELPDLDEPESGPIGRERR